MEHKYAMNGEGLFQQENGPDTFDWVCVLSCTQTQDAGHRVAPADFNEGAFTIFKDVANCVYMMENDRPHLVRKFLEESAQNYLVGCDNDK